MFFEEKIQILTDDIQGTISGACDTLKLSNSFSKEIFILQEILSVFEVVFDIEKKSEYIQMASYHSNSGLTLEYTTLDIADFCKKNIWGQVQNVFLLSATLRV